MASTYHCAWMWLFFANKDSPYFTAHFFSRWQTPSSRYQLSSGLIQVSSLDIGTQLEPNIHYCCCSVIQSCPFVTPWMAAPQASLSSAIFQSWLKLMSFQSVMPYNHLILCHPLFLMPSVFPSIRVFSNELAVRIKWPKYWLY